MKTQTEVIHALETAMEKLTDADRMIDESAPCRITLSKICTDLDNLTEDIREGIERVR